MTLPRLSVHFDTAAEPLRKRAPSHDENGKPLSDFMMLIPGLRDKPKHIIDSAIQEKDEFRAHLGYMMNRLQSASAIIDVQAMNVPSRKVSSRYSAIASITNGA